MMSVIFCGSAMKTVLLVLATSAVFNVCTWCAIKKQGASNAASFFRTTPRTSGDDDVILKLSKMETPDFIKYYGYPCDTHEVVTEDGYILHMHHVAHGRNGSIDENRPAVFLMHGIFSFSGDWFTSGPEKALGFILADNGYDVWVGNARGNKYSRNHTTLNPNTDHKFWNFSWHEIGYYDLPAMIDYVLDYTHEEKLFYIGHSQGTTTYYVMLSMRPRYNSKIMAQFSMAPVAYMSNMAIPGMPFYKTMESAIELSMALFNIQELTNETPLFKFITRKLCTFPVVQGLCITEIFTVAGFNYNQFNGSLLPIIAANFPAGSSLKQLKHYMQEIRSGEFQRYDYNLFDNERYYGSFFPPKYNVKNIKAPIHLIYSKNDYLSSPLDVERLYRELPAGDKHLYLVKDKKWNHIDYLYGIDAKKYVYKYILESMNRYIKKLSRNTR